MTNPELGHPHSSNWLMTSCLVLQALIYRAFKESILQGCFWAACFSMAPWTAPVCCFEHNSVFAVLCSTFQWCFYKMLDKWFACAFWKLTCTAVTQSALSGIVCFPELSVVNCATLDYKSCQCCPVSCSSHRSRVESPRVTGWDTGVQKQPFRPGDLVWKQLETWLSSVHCGTENITAQLKDFFSVSYCAYMFCLPCDCKKSVSATNILIWTTLQWGTFALKQITNYFRWVLFFEVGVCLNKAFMCLTSNSVW